MVLSEGFDQTLIFDVADRISGKPVSLIANLGAVKVSLPMSGFNAS